jgi:hypothetical protein
MIQLCYKKAGGVRKRTPTTHSTSNNPYDEEEQTMDALLSQLSAQVAAQEASFMEATSFMTPTELQAVLDFDPTIEAVPYLVKACYILEKLNKLRQAMREHEHNVVVSEQLFCQCP